MGQGQGGPTSGRQADHAGQEELRGQPQTRSGDFLCTSYPPEPPSLYLRSRKIFVSGKIHESSANIPLRNPIPSSPNSSGPSANATKNAQAATRVYSESNLRRNSSITTSPRATKMPCGNESRTIKPRVRFWNWSTGPRICGSP